MPLYDYECKKCGEVEEKLVRQTEQSPFSFKFPETINCSKCGSTNVQRILGAPAFHLKGDGWAKDLYGSTAVSSKAPGKD